MRGLLLFCLALCSSCCQVGFAQVDVKDAYTTSEPILILVDAPEDSETQQNLNIEIEGPGEWKQLRLIDDAGKPRVGLLVANAPGTYSYRIDCTLTQTVDFNGKKLRVLLDGGFVRKGKFTVGSGPEPAPDESILTPTAKASRDAMAAFVQSMGKNFDALAIESKSGKVRTVTEASALSNQLDLASRDGFKKAMASVMAPKLGTTDLQADAPQVFTEIANGFKAVK